MKILIKRKTSKKKKIKNLSHLISKGFVKEYINNLGKTWYKLLNSKEVISKSVDLN